MEQTTITPEQEAACIAAGLEPDAVQGAILLSVASGKVAKCRVPYGLLFPIANELVRWADGQGLIWVLWCIDGEGWTDTHYTESNRALIEFRPNAKQSDECWTVEVYS